MDRQPHQAVPKRIQFYIGLAVLALVCVGGLAYSQASSDGYAQSVSRLGAMRFQIAEFQQVQGRVQNILDAVEDPNAHFVDPATAIEERVWSLQAAWSDFADAGSRRTPEAFSHDALGLEVDSLALSALRRAQDVRHARSYSGRVAPVNLTGAMTDWRGQADRAMAVSERARARAAESMALGRNIARGAFISMIALVLAGLGVYAGERWARRATVCDTAFVRDLIAPLS